MPIIHEHQTQREVPVAEIPAYLKSHGIHYEYWPVDHVPSSLRTQSSLNAKEKAQILEAFRDDLKRLSDQFGYISHDMIILDSESTPNLEEMLNNFERSHHHTEDEVRFIVDGEGVFTLTRNEETFSITVTAGDLISVPVGTEHYFTLTEARNVKAIRLFQSKDGWVAIYHEDEPRHEAR